MNKDILKTHGKTLLRHENSVVYDCAICLGTIVRAEGPDHVPC